MPIHLSWLTGVPRVWIWQKTILIPVPKRYNLQPKASSLWLVVQRQMWGFHGILWLEPWSLVAWKRRQSKSSHKFERTSTNWSVVLFWKFAVGSSGRIWCWIGQLDPWRFGLEQFAWQSPHGHWSIGHGSITWCYLFAYFKYVTLCDCGTCPTPTSIQKAAKTKEEEKQK